MSHKLVGFADSQTSLYIKNQLLAIANDISDLETELANENDSRLQRYCKKPDRMPCLMVFKNDVHLNHAHAKFNAKEALAWVRGAIG
jgi:hypothetical protein|tara:strand:+ start:1052 stop:1312 length:261 start_codon:yes stop_codon:yes gene_type:complete